MTYTFAAVFTKDELGYVAYCPEVSVTTQGKTIEEAHANLKEAVELYLDEEEDVAHLIGTAPFISTFSIEIV